MFCIIAITIMQARYLKRTIFLTFLICVLGVSAIFPNEERFSVSFQVSPLFSDGILKLKVALTFKGDNSGLTLIKLPSAFAGQDQLYKAIQNLRVSGNSAQLIDTDSPEIKQIKHLPNENILIEYEVAQDWRGNPTAGTTGSNPGGGYRPIIQNDYFHVLGNGFWVLPKRDAKTSLDVSIRWNDFPQNWKFANSFGSNQLTQRFRTNEASFATSVFVGGDFRLIQRSVEGKPVWTAIRGKWNFSDEEFADLVEKIVTVERTFWRDFDHPYFLITAIPLEGQDMSLASGTGLTNSFAAFMTSNLKTDAIAALIAHEYFHNWNTTAFGGLEPPEPLRLHPPARR